MRTVLSLVALASLFVMQPHAVAASQGKTTVAAAKAATATMVNVNTASATDFERLPGIGAKTAARIVEYRQKNGPFKKVEEILETSRSCPYSLSVFDLGSRPSVSRSR